MPLSELQAEVLRFLAGNRNPESFVAGGVPLNVAARRTSKDIDIFHSGAERLMETADADAALLAARGYAVEWLQKREAICTATITKGDRSTRLDWVVDSDFRFFPPMPDPTFGYVLHPADIATNKALAAAGRREPRDAVDLITIHEQFYPLGAVIWAAVGKDPGWSPESLISEIRRNARYQDYELSGLQLERPITAAALSQKLRAALNEAETFVTKMPSADGGKLFLDERHRIVQPDPEKLDRYTTHAGTRGGHWPSSSEVASSMLKAWSIRKP